MIVAYLQFNDIIKTNNIKLINDVRSSLTLLSNRIAETVRMFEIAKESQKEVYRTELDVYLENYLNVLDNFCFNIIKGYVNQKMVIQYKQLIIKTVRNNKKSFGVDTSYNNILEIYNKWYKGDR